MPQIGSDDNKNSVPLRRSIYKTSDGGKALNLESISTLNNTEITGIRFLVSLIDQEERKMPRKKRQLRKRSQL